ncbi:MAG: GGDEF domain-containing protein [Kordiimonadaceae bacterium]|nr:GGDEF domain-containing protein [Kordiimonadaceae bacterium]
MAIDVSSLSFAVLLVMLVSCMALTAHWFSNKAISGLNLVAVGVVVFALGSGLQFNYIPLEGITVTLLGEALLIFGHMWVWHGIAEFLQNRQHPLVRSAVFIGSAAVGILVYQAYANVDFALRVVTHAVFVAILSGGIIYTLVRAGGGSGRFYKGIIRRTMVGAGMMAALFLVHLAYGLYRGYHIYTAADDQLGTILPLDAVSQIEAMLFVVMLAFIVIIMTAERLQAELKIQEMMDPLTRALNRRAYLEVMKAVLARARRLAEPVSVIMMDIDKFKKINQKHGRRIGDATLAAFAALVMEGRRGQDVFCRFGGEEFVLMLPGTSEEGCKLVAARIRSKIEKTALAPEGVAVKLTVSMGLATARGDDLDADGMLNVVDRRMHKDQKMSFEKIESAG